MGKNVYPVLREIVKVKSPLVRIALLSVKVNNGGLSATDQELIERYAECFSEEPDEDYGSDATELALEDAKCDCDCDCNPLKVDILLGILFMPETSLGFGGCGDPDCHICSL